MGKRFLFHLQRDEVAAHACIVRLGVDLSQNRFQPGATMNEIDPATF